MLPNVRQCINTPLEFLWCFRFEGVELVAVRPRGRLDSFDISLRPTPPSLLKPLPHKSLLILTLTEDVTYKHRLNPFFEL